MAPLLVAALQILLAAVAGGIAWLGFGVDAAQAAVAGGGCALAGTLAYVLGQKLVPGRGASRVLWGHLTGEALKVGVALSLLFWGLSADPGFAAGPFLAGFIVALLAYPLALPLFKST